MLKRSLGKGKGIVLFFVMLVLIRAVFAQPTYHQFYGTVKYSDGSNAPDGTAIEAEINGVAYESAINSGGRYGYSPLFIVENANDGDIIEFYVGNTLDKTAIFGDGEVTRLNMVAPGGAAATGGATSTVTGGGGGGGSTRTALIDETIVNITEKEEETPPLPGITEEEAKKGAAEEMPAEIEKPGQEGESGASKPGKKHAFENAIFYLKERLNINISQGVSIPVLVSGLALLTVGITSLLVRVFKKNS